MKISLSFTHPWCILGLFDFLISDKSNQSYIKNRPGYSKRSPSGTRAASNATRNAISDIQLWIMCNQSKLTARHQVRVMSWPGSLKHVRCSRRQLSVIQQISLCVSVTYMFCESYLLLFVKVTQASKAPACQRHHLKLIRAKVDHVIDCVFLPAHVISRAGIHTVCAWSAWEWSTQSVRALEGAGCPHCERLPLRTLCSRRVLFEEGAFTSVPRVAGLASAEAEWRLHSWGSQLDLAEGMEMDGPLSSSSPARSIARSLGSEARSALSSPQRVGSALLLSSSEGEDVEITDYLPIQSPQYEELLEVVTHTVAKLNIDWPAKNQTEQQKRKLDECFLLVSRLTQLEVWRPPRTFSQVHLFRTYVTLLGGLHP